MADNKNNLEEPIIVKKIIKKVAHHGHHGGAWKVAYADFVTAMMCLFLLLWLVNVDPSSKETIANFFRQPTQTGPMEGNLFIFGGAKSPTQPGHFEGGSSFFEFEKIILTGQNKEDLKKVIQTELQKELELSSDEELLAKVEFNLVSNGILIELKDTDTMETFSSGSAVLGIEARKIIDKLAIVLRNRISPIVVAGYTDGRRFSLGNYDNWNLSTDRAIAVKTRLVYGGVNSTRFARIEGYADTQLKNPDKPIAAINRRITILLLEEEATKSLQPQYVNPEAANPLHEVIDEERVRDAQVKTQGIISPKSIGSTAGRSDKPLTLEDIKRKKAREAFYKQHPFGYTVKDADSARSHQDSDATGETPASGGGH